VRESPTIHDVARRAGVSIATVSRVLNGTARVKDDRIQRVHAAVEALKYQPNRSARTLRVRRSNVIGLLVSNIDNPFFTALVHGVETVAQRAGFSVILANTGEVFERERQCVEVLCAEQVAGAIVVPTRDNHRTMRLFKEHGIPVVTVDRRIDDRTIDSIVVDNVRGAHDAVTHLIGNGYRRIGMITGPQSTTTGRERFEGYRQALLDAGISPDPALERYGTFKQESGREMAEELLSLQPPPDALFVANNLMTLGALEAIYARNLRIPADLAIVGFDEMPWAALASISLTTVSQPVYELGSTAALRLFQRLHDPGPFTRQNIVLMPTLCVRGSSRPRGSAMGTS
jgi:DNA-binding LacI/PurR family transcriptional regulator